MRLARFILTNERVDQSRSMFLAILSHDLRNPLNCIRTATLLVSRAHGDPESAAALSMIETNTEAITRLISDLIDFASTAQEGTTFTVCLPRPRPVGGDRRGDTKAAGQ